MRESTREFLRDLGTQFHDDRVSEVDLIGAAQIGNQEKRWEHERKVREAEKKARLEMYQRGQVPEDEAKAAREALKNMVLPTINAQIAANHAKEAQFMDKISNLGTAQEGREQIERLLEITQDKADYINKRIEDAKAQGNELLLEEYTQEKAEVDKDLEIYRGKYEEYKAAAEG